MEREANLGVEVAQDSGLDGFLPSGFGKQSRSANLEAQLELAKRKIKDDDDAENQSDKGSQESHGDSDDDDSDASDEGNEFPISHELVIPTHNRPVTSATLDNGGNRLVTGSADCTIKYHDISSMNPTTVRAFKEVDPTATKTSGNNETHPIHQVLYNPIASSSILVITAHPQVKVFDREGQLVGNTVKGDMYLRDMHNTKGHVSEATCGDWHPHNKETFMTAGTDSTIRIWDVKKVRQQTNVIVHKSKKAGSAGRSRMTAVKYGASSVRESSTPSSFLAAAAYDGTLSMWDTNGPFLRPSAEVRDAHTPETWTSSLDVSPDSRLIITRGGSGDDTLKLWDTRKLTKALRTAPHPSTSSHYPTSTVRFSPSGSQILVGAPSGHLHILNAATLRPEIITPVSPGSPVISAFWHPKLNQIITTSADGTTRLLFNPHTSHAGALTVMSKVPKHRHIDDDPNRVMDLSAGFSEDAIVNPGVRNRESGKKQTGLTMSGKSRDPRRPHVPEATPFGHNTPDEKHVKERIQLSSMRDEDPREALLKYAGTDRDRVFTKAWAETQPETEYARLSDGEEEEGREVKRVKR